MSTDRDDPIEGLAQALARWDAAELAEMIEEARAGAREEIATVLRSAARRRLLTDLLDHLAGEQGADLLGHLAGEQGAAEAPEPAPAASAPRGEEPQPSGAEHRGPAPDTSEARYVYGVTRADTPVPRDLGGLEGAALETIDVPPLRAVVSRIDPDALSGGEQQGRAADPAELEGRVRAHDEVLRRLLPEGAVVPLRFGTAVATEGDVRALLSGHGSEFQSALSRLASAAEWGVKGHWSDEALHRHVASAREAAGVDGPESAVGGGTSYLLARQRRREMSSDAARVRDRVVSECHRRLSQAARDAVLLPLGSAAGDRDRRDLVLNGSYLVPQDWLGEFHQTVSELSAAHADAGLVLEATGPWPPYSFVGALALEGAGR